MTGLRNYARISKSKIRYILSQFNSSAIKVNNKSIANKCLTCTLKQSAPSFKINFNNQNIEENSLDESNNNDDTNLNKFVEDYCKNYCDKYSHNNNGSEDEEFYFAYLYEYFYGTAEIVTDSFKRFIIKKSAIKQYLLYHFIPGNKSLLRKSVSYKTIAKLCNLSLPTVKKNHQLLVEAGLIHSTDLGLGKFNFIITDEHKNHLKKSEGGTGYISMSLESLNHLISFNSINELRVELIKFLWVDARTGSIGKNVKFKKENLIEFLPSYIKKSKKKIDEIVNSKNSLFECINNKKLNTSKYETSDELLNRLRQEATEVISNLFKDKEDVFSANYCGLLAQLKSCNPHLTFIKDDLEYKLASEKAMVIKDLAELAVQYGIHKVKSAINYMLSDAHTELNSDLDMNETDIKNPGAFVRTLIVNSINNDGSLEQIAT